MWSEDNFIAGHPALDFLNTVSDTGKTREGELLVSAQELIAWSEHGDSHPNMTVPAETTQKHVDELVCFRESAYQAVLAMLDSSGHQNVASRQYERYLKSTLQRATFDIQAKPLAWQASKATQHHVLDSFVLVLDDLLRSTQVERIRQCERCTWLFLNNGRGRGRRWCNMATCGNRHKIQSYRERNRATDC